MVLNNKIEVRKSPLGGGYGLYAREPIKKDEWIWREESSESVIPKDRQYILDLPEEARRIFLHFAYETGEGRYEGLKEFDELPMDQWHTIRSSDEAMYMNHACEPSCWFVHPKNGLADHCDLMVACHDIQIDEEVTFDYATSEAHEFFEGFPCGCGHASCRRQVTKDDWKNPQLQLKYSGHFLRHVAIRIAKHNLKEKWHFEVKENEQLGRYLVANVNIPAQEIVLRMPPNRLLTHDEVKNFNQVLQVDHDLYSDCLSDEDLELFLAHSCDPNCYITISKSDYTVDLISLKEIAAGTPISFDYETTEHDLTKQNTSFSCQCGAINCRGAIAGSNNKAN